MKAFNWTPVHSQQHNSAAPTTRDSQKFWPGVQALLEAVSLLPPLLRSTQALTHAAGSARQAATKLSWVDSFYLHRSGTLSNYKSITYTTTHCCLQLLIAVANSVRIYITFVWCFLSPQTPFLMVTLLSSFVPLQKVSTIAAMSVL